MLITVLSWHISNFSLSLSDWNIHKLQTSLILDLEELMQTRMQ